MEIGKLKKRFNTIYTHYHYFGFWEAVSLILVEVFGDCFWAFREKMIIRFLKRNFSDIVEKYKDSEYPTDTISEDAPIWTFWAQGEENMPEIAKKCLELVKRNAGGRKVILLDMKSVRDYINLPEELYEKTNHKQIKIAHFSDVVRCALLSKYGGIWIDACVLLTRPFSKFDNCYYTISGHMKSRCFAEKWVCSVQASTPDNPFHSSVQDILEKYHQMGLPPFDYFLLDYAMFFVYKEIRSIKQMVDFAQRDAPDYHFISRNRSVNMSREDVIQCFSKNILLRASYQWEKPEDFGALYWKIFDL